MWRGVREVGISLQILLTSPEIWRKGFPFLIVALFLSFWSEIYFIGSRYNTILLLASLVSSTIDVGKNSTRQYFIFLFLIVLSILLDLKSFLSETNSSTTPFRRLGFYGINLSKGLAIRNILHYSATAIRIRKYLHRFQFSWPLSIIAILILPLVDDSESFLCLAVVLVNCEEKSFQES
jgi:hypothetical protein